MKTDVRATLQIRIAINKILKTKHSINTEIAKIISNFSHGTMLQEASQFESFYPAEYFIVQKVLSPFWAMMLYLPGRMAYYQGTDHQGSDFARLYFTPDWSCAKDFAKKKIFDPYGNPFIKKRKKKFYLRKPLVAYV